MSSHSELWSIFPYPTLYSGRFSDGSTLETHPSCAACPKQECQQDKEINVGEYAVCRYGLVYAPIDDSRSVVGVVGANLSNPTQRARQRYRNERERHVRTDSLLRAIEQVRRVAPGLIDDMRSQRALALEELKSDPALLAAVGNELRKDLDENLSQSHDFLQLVKVIRGHAEVLLRNKHPNLEPEEAAEKEPTEGSIYFATTLMASKVDSLIFLKEVNRAFGDQRKFAIHPLLLKYLRIYQWQASQKKLKIELIGQCFATCYYNVDAIIAIIQGMLDNLIKYAPARSKAAIHLKEEEDYVTVSFNSLGPQIAADERGKIFLPRFRGHAARDIESSGQGIGLGIIKELSDVLGLDVKVDQKESESQQHPGRYETNFSVRLRKLETIAGENLGSY